MKKKKKTLEKSSLSVTNASINRFPSAIFLLQCYISTLFTHKDGKVKNITDVAKKIVKASFQPNISFVDWLGRCSKPQAER